MIKHKFCTRILSTLLCVTVAVGCAPSERPLSEDELANKASVSYCMSKRAQAGFDSSNSGRLGRSCEQENPTTPAIEERRLMTLLAERGLAAETQAIVTMTDGDCKDVATQYVALHEKAYRLNSGVEKTQLLNAAETMLSNLKNKGLCTPIAKAKI